MITCVLLQPDPLDLELPRFNMQHLLLSMVCILLQPVLLDLELVPRCSAMPAKSVANTYFNLVWKVDRIMTGIARA